MEDYSRPLRVAERTPRWSVASRRQKPISALDFPLAVARIERSEIRDQTYQCGNAVPGFRGVYHRAGQKPAPAGHPALLATSLFGSPANPAPFPDLMPPAG